MSRNSDRANTVLFRYQEQKAESKGYIDYNSTARPRSVQKVSILKDAEAWRKQTATEISQKLIKIQDEKLADNQIRDLNDEINKLIKEKIAWEHRIKELGGPDYLQENAYRFTGSVSHRGHRYFGRAKELPDIKELLEKQQQKLYDIKVQNEEKKTTQQRIADLQSRANLEYFGYNDEVNSPFQDSIGASGLTEAKNLLNLSSDDDDHNGNMLNDELLKFERKASRKKRKELLKKNAPTPIIQLQLGEPPSKNEIEAHLVKKKKEKLRYEFDL